MENTQQFNPDLVTISTERVHSSRKYTVAQIAPSANWRSNDRKSIFARLHPGTPPGGRAGRPIRRGRAPFPQKQGLVPEKTSI